MGLTCCECGKAMHQTAKSRPQGEARCFICRKMIAGEAHRIHCRNKYRAKVGIPLDAPLHSRSA